MKLKRFTILLISLVFAVWQSFAQSVPSGYSVGTWSGFRTAAATFTFDDDAPSHITVVAPAFEERGYRATFNVVVNWMNQANQWSSFQKLANKGHEIASHTVTHSQNTPSDELSSSKTTINQKITGQDCNTIAYPYCNVPSDRNALSQNYIGGRICDGQVMGKTPSDYFQISAITTGSEANFTSTSNFTSSMQSAISKGGWVVFLTHGIQGESNGNATYSPTDISAITGALDWAKQNDSKIWVATFRDAILYAKERDALKLTETTESSKLKLTVSVNITSSIVEYDYPITVRREMPNGWSNISVSLNNEDIDVEMKTVNGKQYAEFDVIPGKTYYLENRAKKSWDIFLLFGQSNMAGQGTIEAIDRVTNDQVKVLAYNNCSSLGRTYNQWYTAAPPLHGCYEGVGIGDWFAKTLIDSGYTDTIALVPCAISGVDIDFFRKDVVSSRRNEFSIPPDNNWDGAYDFMIQRLTLAMEKGTIKGILLHQGESDSGNEQWLTKVQEIIADLKEDLGFGDVPVLVGEIPYKSVCSGHNTVVNKITNYVPNSKVISAEGLDGMNDDYHLDAASYRTFGKRYAAGYLSLVRGESGSSGDGTLTNLISNGEFDDGTSGWQTQTGGDAKCTMTATTSAGLSGANAVQFCPDGNYGTENWHIQMFQNVMLEPNVDYTLKFTAKGGSSRILYVMVQKIAADYDTYFYKEYNLTTSAQEFEEIITTPADVAADSKVTFCIGGADGCLYLDKVSFTYEETGGGGGGGGGDNPHYDVDITGDISKYFIDKAYVGPSCDALEGEEVTNGAYFTGVYPNLFVKYLGKTQAQVDQKMQSLWNHFFTVNGQNTVYYEVGNDMAYIYDTGNQDVRTEGMSYGLMICLQMGDREKFDKIWRWAKKYMQYKKGDQREGLFAWQCETNGNIKGASCAPDGEMYFLTALWFASHRWGNDGAINYEEEAQYLAKMILEKPNRQAGAVSPIFNYTNHIVTFGETSYGFSDPSYNLPGFLELWARWSDTHRDFWVQTPAAARGLLQNSCHSRTGLFPDYCQFDGTPYRPDWAGYNTARYQYDASRSAMNVGMDYNWFASDAQQPAMMERLLKFFQSDNFQHGYFDWDGSNASDGYNQAMHGSNGVAVFALQNNDNLAKTYVQRLWDAQVPTGQWRYYNGMVYFLSMLHASGYFKIYKPCPEVIEENLSGPAPIEFNGEEYSKDTTFKTLIDCKIYDVTITIEASSNYTVTFVDYNDEVLKTEEVAAGESATAPTEPTREGYDFAGWDTDFSNVTSNLTVKATYTEKEKADYTALNAAIAQAEALTEDNYTAATWSALQTALTAANAVDKNLYADDQATVNAATEALTAAIEALAEVTFTVTFVDWDDTPIGDAQIIKKGGAAQAPANPTREGYTFVGWDTEFTNVDSDLTVKATYNKKDAGSKYEAENAQGNGTQTVSNNTASGGKYVRMNEGSLTFTVNVESAGMYTAKFAYSLTEDYKAQFLSVNGSQVGTVGFNKSGSANPTFATVEACVMLNAGSNTIALTKSWGYVDIDYLEISEYERTQFNIDEALVTPNPQPATVEVYEFLKDNFGKKTISGVMTLDLLKNNNILPLASQPEVSYINSKTGKTPALVGFDFMHSTGKNSTNDWQQLYTQAAIAMAEELWNAGGIPTFSWHWRDPNQNGDSFNTSETSFDLTKAFSNSSYTQWNTNSTEYKNMIKDIDIIAGYLEELQCAGVTILWRPIHEASGKWFWWGAKGAEPYKQLYKLLFDRLVNYHQIHNLIWVWNSDGTDADWYPGDEYVDVVGRDFYYDDGSTYNHSSLVTDFEALAKQTNGKKLITLAENGAVPYPENMDNDDAMWSWFMPWYGDYVTSSSHNTASDWNTIMNDSRVITLSDMGGWDNRTKIYDTTTVETLYAKNGFSVTPSKEGDSEHEITVTSSHNCDSVVVLYLHADAAVIVNYTVSFVDYDDSPITSVEVVEGESATAPEDPTREGYDFAGWDTDFSNVTADLTVKATYIIKTFTVSFVDWDNSPIGEAQTVDYGTAAVAPTAPTREHFTFKQWDTDFSNVKANLTVKAVYEENAKAEYTALNNAIAQAEALTEDEYTAESWSALQTALTSAKAVDKSLYAEDQATVDAATSALTSAINALAEQTYTVTFIGKDGQELKKETVKKGESATAPEAPVVDGFTFSGWSGSFENVTADVTITAQYTEHGKADYTALNNAIAQAEALTEDEYTAESWSALQTALTSAKAVDKSLYAEDQATVDAATSALTSAINALAEQTYTVTFIGKDGQELKKETVKKGESATAPEAPVVDGFTFSGWSGSFENVTADVTITAQYTEHGKADYTALNNAIAQAEALTEDEYTAESWSALQTALTNAKAVDKDLYAESQSVIDAATEALISAISALAEQTYTVTFKDWDGTVLKQQTVKRGESATAPSSQPTRDGFQFSGWDGSFSNVTADVDIVATYTENMADYSGLLDAISQAEALQSAKFTDETWAEVENALAAAKNIEKNMPVSYQLTIDNAKQSLLLAIESLSVKTFTVQFIADGQVIATQIVKYGESANAPSVQNKEGYDFVKWNGVYTQVVADVDVIAEFTIKTFVVQFVDFDGAELDKQTVEYGKSAVKPADPVREGFEFTGWVGDFTSVTADVVVRASYTEIGMAVYTQLDNAISKAEALLQTKYSPETWNAMQSALADAKAVERNLEEEQQSIVDNAAIALNNAINALKLNSFKVRFVADGRVIDEQIVEYGGSAKMPTVIPEKDGYDFVQWQGSFINVTEEVTITAEFALKAMADYSSLDAAISRANAVDNKKYNQESLANLQTALYNASLLDRNLYAEQQSIVNASTRAILDAIDGLTLKTFKVTFIVDDEPIWTQTISYGGAAVAPAAPTKAGYTFVRWNGSFSYVTEDVDVVAVFAVSQANNVDKTVLNYTISEANAAISKAEGNIGANPGQYPASAVIALQDAIDAASDVYETAQRQVVIDNEVTILSNAIEVFLESINPEKPDMSELTVLIKHATQLLETTSVGDKPGQYPRLQNWELSNAVQDGNALYDKKRLDQATVDAQVEVLREKIEAYLNAEIKEKTAVDDVADNTVRIYSKGHYVVVENAEIQDVQVFDISGRCISKNGQNAVSETEIFVERIGMYIVKVGIIAQRVVIK